MCISLDFGRIWPDEVYVDEVYDHTNKLSMLSIHRVFILIIYIYYSSGILVIYEKI